MDLAIAAAESRRRRRIGMRVAAAVAACALAAVAVGPSLVGGEEGAVYRQEEVTRAEALSRCLADAADQGIPIEAGKAYRVNGFERPEYAGSVVQVEPDPPRPRHRGWPCQIPFAGRSGPASLEGPVADASDHAGVLGQCGLAAGFDFTGWEVKAAASGAGGTDALLRSGNGFTADCTLEPGVPPRRRPEQVRFASFSQERLREIGLSSVLDLAYVFHLDIRRVRPEPDRPPRVLYSGAGTLKGRGQDGLATDATRVVVTIRGTGETFEVPVSGGYYAVRRLADAKDGRLREFDYVVHGEGDVVLHRGGSDDVFY